MEKGYSLGWLPANVLNLYYRILQNHGSQPCFLPKSETHPFFIENIANPSEPFFEGLFRLRLQSCQRWLAGSPGVFLGHVGMRRVSEGGWILNQTFSHVTLPLPSQLPPPHWSKSQVGRALGPAAKTPLDWHQQQVRWGPQLLPVPEDTPQPGACGG